jgi:hypothetical protein
MGNPKVHFEPRVYKTNRLAGDQQCLLIRISHCKRHSAGSTVTSAGEAVLTFVVLALGFKLHPEPATPPEL